MPIIGQLSISRAAFWQLKEVLDPLEKYPLKLWKDVNKILALY